MDCVLLTGPGFPEDAAAEAQLRSGLPFLDIALVGPQGFDRLARFFGTDRLESPKGMVELVQWT